MLNQQQILVALISVIGGGTIVPFLYGIYKRRQPAEIKRVDAKEDERASKAAREAVDAVRDVLKEMRTQREEDRKEIASLNGQVKALREKVEWLEQSEAGLKRRVAELEGA